MIRQDDFPPEVQSLIDELTEGGFEFTYGKVKGDGSRIGFIAENEETVIQVTDRTQTWFLTMRDPKRPDVDDCWDDLSRVRGDIWEWLQDYPDD